MRMRWRARIVIAILLSVTTSAVGAERAPSAKYVTTPEVRQTMGELRKAVIDHHTLITHRRLPRIAATKLADSIRRSAQALRNGADTEGGAVLLEYAEKLERGAAAIAGAQNGRTTLDGLFDLVGVLESYTAQFDHLGWKGLQDQ